MENLTHSTPLLVVDGYYLRNGAWYSLNAVGKEDEETLEGVINRIQIEPGLSLAVTLHGIKDDYRDEETGLGLMMMGREVETTFELIEWSADEPVQNCPFDSTGARLARYVWVRTTTERRQ